MSWSRQASIWWEISIYLLLGTLDDDYDDDNEDDDDGGDDVDDDDDDDDDNGSWQWSIYQKWSLTHSALNHIKMWSDAIILD